MKKMFLGILVLVLLCPVRLMAQEPRVAVIEDVSDVTSEVSEIVVSVYFYKDAKKFTFPEVQYSDNLKYVVLSSDLFDVAVPVDSIVSLEAREGLFEMRYLWNGQEILSQGKPVNQETLQAKSDFGDYKIKLEKVKRLSFKQPPLSAEMPRSAQKNFARLTFLDGTELNIQGLHVYDEHYSTDGYLVGGTTVYGFRDTFGFKRGESAAAVKFDTIQSIEFKGSDPIQVEVTLKNGKKVSGTIMGAADLSGVSDKGFVCINTKKIKSIQFLNEEQ